MSSTPLPLRKLIEHFASLPGIGSKSAQRLAFHILSLPTEQVTDFAKTLTEAKTAIHNCRICQNFTDKEICDICASPERDASLICVVESPKDVMAFERLKDFNGTYHVLHGLISPMDGVMPNQLKIRELLARLQNQEVREIIMATNPTVEGDATAMYLARLLKPMDIMVTRLAFGLPVGGILEYADEVTLYKALENRNEM